MTRFARAKGSKSSNEKKPEEATSWSEFKNSMLSKKLSTPPEKFELKEEKKLDLKNQTEWASLGEDNKSVSLLKPNLGKIEKKAENGIINKKSETKKKNKKLKNLNKADKNLNLLENDSEVKKKKKKIDSGITEVKPEVSEIKVKKKNKKRKSAEIEEDSETVSPKKKKKLQDIKKKELKSGENKKEERNKHSDTKGGKKYPKMKKEDKRNFKSKQNDKKFSKQLKGKKKFNNREFEERNPAVEELIINGEKIPIVKFQGFYVTLEDAERLKKLRNEMKKEGIPKAKVEIAIKLERRRAEKALSRLKKSVCFHCRGHGHLLSNCPELTEKENTGTGICYKCGSTEHSAGECKVVRGTNYQFAECFICKEQGHIARQCPDNPRGLYPQGGACRECGDVTHLRKDCPQVLSHKAEEVVTVGMRNDRDLECLDEEIASREKQNFKKVVKRNSAVTF